MSTWDRETVAKYLSLADESRLSVLHPYLLDVISDLEDKTVLDFGCGEARLAARLASSGARRVLAVDFNPLMIEAAHSSVGALESDTRARITLRVSDETELAGEAGFGIVVCSLVLMMASTHERVCAIVERLSRVLAPQGRLIVAVTHPCFRAAVHSTFRNELPSGFEYWSSGTPYGVRMFDRDGAVEVLVTDYHWTVSDYCIALRRAGLAVARVGELGTKPGPFGRYEDPPAYLVLDAIRTRPEAVIRQRPTNQ